MITNTELLEFLTWLEEQEDINAKYKFMFQIVAVVYNIPDFPDTIYKIIKSKEYEKLKRI